MKRTGLLLTLQLVAAATAYAQSPPPVPALPDSPRLTSFSLTGSTCNCSVGFAIYGDGTDVDNWLDVFVNGVSAPSTDPAHGWSLSSATGSLGSIPRPITNAVLTFASPQTGTVNIVGARRPRRLSQFQENRGVTARDLNQVITDEIAMLREGWDFQNRAIVGQPGEVLNPLPPSNMRLGKLLAFDGVGQPFVVDMSSGGGGGVSTSNPNIWTALQSFTAGAAANQYRILGAFNNPNSAIDIEPNLTWRGNMLAYNFGNPAFVFNDLTMTGDSFSDSGTHFAALISGNKVTTTSVPSGTGSYTGLMTQQTCAGMSNTGYCTGAQITAIAAFNPNSTQNFGNFSGSNPTVIIPATTGCPTCGAMNISFAVGEEINFFVSQPVGRKESLRIADLSSAAGTIADIDNSSIIHMLKASTAQGVPVGISINSDFASGAFNDSGYPITAGGEVIKSNTTTLSLACFICLDGMLGGFSQASIVLPAASDGIKFIIGTTAVSTNTLLSILTNGANTISYGIDLLNRGTGALTITNFAFRSLGFSVNGTGVINNTAAPTGTPVASLCLDASGNIIKKTTAGSCI